MTGKVDERFPKNLFVGLMIEKANIIKDHLKKKCTSIDHSGQYWTHYDRIQIL